MHRAMRNEKMASRQEESAPPDDQQDAKGKKTQNRMNYEKSTKSQQKTTIKLKGEGAKRVKERGQQ